MRNGLLTWLWLLPVLLSVCGGAAELPDKWVASWGCSLQGPYPNGVSPVQPGLLVGLPAANGGRAHEQTFRLAVRPDLWAGRMRLRFSNRFSSEPLQLADVHVGLQQHDSVVASGTNERVLFGGQNSVVIPPGDVVWSDPAEPAFVPRVQPQSLAGRRALVSFHVVGTSGGIGWHPEALTTSYLTRPGSGSAAAGERGDFETTTSWFVLDRLEVLAPATTKVVVAFGDSITNGTGSGLDADDGWVSILSRRLHASFGSKVAVINAGIGGNQVAGPAAYSLEAPFAGGRSAVERMDDDVASVAGLGTVIWTEGINDLASSAISPEAIFDRMRDAVGRLRQRVPGVRVILGTLTPALGSDGDHGTPSVDRRRRRLNAMLRGADFADGVVDFDRATADGDSGGLRAEYVLGRVGDGGVDKLHPNGAGHLAMGEMIDLVMVTGVRD